MLSAARKRAADTIAQARAEAVQDKARIVERACSEATLQRERTLSDTASRLERKVGIDPATADRSIEAIVRRVCGF